jgi:hypothetical protein
VKINWRNSEVYVRFYPFVHLRTKNTDPYIKSYIESNMSLPDPPDIVSIADIAEYGPWGRGFNILIIIIITIVVVVVVVVAVVVAAAAAAAAAVVVVVVVVVVIEQKTMDLHSHKINHLITYSQL